MEFIIAILGIILGGCIAGFIYVKRIRIDQQTVEQNASLHEENEKLARKREELEEMISYYSATLTEKIQALDEIEARHLTIKEEVEALGRLISEYTIKKESLDQQEKDALERLLQIHEKEIEAQEKSQAELSKARQNYIDTIEASYKTIETEYDSLIIEAREAYDKLQDEALKEIELNAEKRAVELNEQFLAQKHEIMAQLDKEREELAKIRATRTAAIEAIKKEAEIREQQEFYCLKITSAEAGDIARLEAIKPQLSNPRILSMLIWSTFYQKPMTTLCNNILGTTTITGIYKITNLETNQCYIGQAVNISDRWKQHCKCGLGIDTPQGNKLYKAMMEYGVHNFSWELLEACSSAELNEKESYYIELYQSKDYGYNSTKGTK